MAMQEIDHHGADPSAILHWSRYSFRERRLSLLAALGAAADVGAMLGDQRRTWLGQVKDLPLAMGYGRRRRQRRSAAGAASRIMIDHMVRGRHLPQRLARMSLLTAPRLPGRLPQAHGPRRPLGPVARRRLAAVAAVETEPALQLGNPGLLSFNQRLQRGVLRQHLLDLRNQEVFGVARAIGPIHRVSHW
jgi:hypothetical protein